VPDYLRLLSAFSYASRNLLMGALATALGLPIARQPSNYPNRDARHCYLRLFFTCGLSVVSWAPSHLLLTQIAGFLRLFVARQPKGLMP